MRSIGLGHSALKRFCGMMNMPQPVAKNNYTKLSNKLKGSAQFITEQSMAAAAREVTEIKGTSDIGVSVDITWQKRGFASLNGVVVAISTTNFKVLDVEMM